MCADSVKVGCVYWVTIGFVRMRVRALRQSAEQEGWWHCETIRGSTSLILPVSSDWTVDRHVPGSPAYC
jgi:hypothetical protein